MANNDKKKDVQTDEDMRPRITTDGGDGQDVPEVRGTETDKPMTGGAKPGKSAPSTQRGDSAQVRDDGDNDDLGELK